jgi:histidine triad (HIT) family protein
MCIFCQIASNEIPSYKIYEDQSFLAFLDISQATIGHTLVIPKKHFDNLLALDEETSEKILPLVTKITKALAKALNTNDFNIINNCGLKAGQTINHFHIHIIPRYENDNLQIHFSSNKLTPDAFSSLQQSILNEMNK